MVASDSVSLLKTLRGNGTPWSQHLPCWLAGGEVFAAVGPDVSLTHTWSKCVSRVGRTMGWCSFLSRKTGKPGQSDQAGCFGENLSPRPSVDILLLFLSKSQVFV